MENFARMAFMKVANYIVPKVEQGMEAVGRFFEKANNLAGVALVGGSAAQRHLQQAPALARVPVTSEPRKFKR
jgi:hypothetical protein